MYHSNLYLVHSYWEGFYAKASPIVSPIASPATPTEVLCLDSLHYTSIIAEKAFYNCQVVVKFNLKAYAHSTNIVEWLNK
ncbi:hypothetical protein L873DRAFT_1052738 [Choiromyces venosus 120613-1]|uniref:Uncharacterized protein n=1 Tax=Choiromyces venosus 120613-1 TaxID=1336337 RepID=A0A3N4JIP8_9PEZI|nr:hypothetical protein L873DRAFT_1052738 [Choiromyces venosus 120613-1]